MLLIWDNLQGHHTPELALWLFAHGVLPLYTPIGGSWLNMAESIQRILVRRALHGQNPDNPQQIINWLEAVVRCWNAILLHLFGVVHELHAVNEAAIVVVLWAAPEPVLSALFELNQIFSKNGGPHTN